MSPVKWYLFKRNNGVWCVGYLDNGRKPWKSARCTVKVEALRKIADSPELILAPRLFRSPWQRLRKNICDTPGPHSVRRLSAYIGTH
jgi:hypothetical protein